MADLLRVTQPESELCFERFNIAPTQEVLVAVEDEGGRRMEELRWGLVPEWTQGVKPRFQMINARAETVLERPAYRDLVHHGGHRCLVVADGWYEWQRPEDPRQPRRPVHFSRSGGEPVCFAGLWTRQTPSCTILTCEANDLSRPIHDRMPVVLDEHVWDAWLDPTTDDVGALESMLVPAPDEWFEVYPVSTRVNTPDNNDADLVQRVPADTLL